MQKSNLTTRTALLDREKKIPPTEDLNRIYETATHPNEAWLVSVVIQDVS